MNPDYIEPDPYFRERYKGLRIFRIPSDPDQTYHVLKLGPSPKLAVAPFMEGLPAWALRDAAYALFYTQDPTTILKLIERPGHGGLLKYLLEGMSFEDALSTPWPPRIDRFRRSEAIDISDLDLDLDL